MRSLDTAANRRGSQQQPARKNDRINSTRPIQSAALRAQDGSRSGRDLNGPVETRKRVNGCIKPAISKLRRLARPGLVGFARSDHRQYQFVSLLFEFEDHLDAGDLIPFAKV